MGWAAARKLRRAIDGLARVLAIEVVTGCRALDLRAPLRPAPVTGAVRDLVRTVVEGPGPDRFVAPDLEAATQLVVSGEVARAAFAPASKRTSAAARTNRPQSVRSSADLRSSAAPTASSTGRAATAFRRSWPVTPASTAAT